MYIQVLIIPVVFLCEESREIYKITDLGKLLTLIQIEFFQFLSKLIIYPWDTYSSKNNSEVDPVMRKQKDSMTYAFVTNWSWTNH